MKAFCKFLVTAFLVLFAGTGFASTKAENSAPSECGVRKVDQYSLSFECRQHDNSSISELDDCFFDEDDDEELSFFKKYVLTNRCFTNLYYHLILAWQHAGESPSCSLHAVYQPASEVYLMNRVLRIWQVLLSSYWTLLIRLSLIFYYEQNCNHHGDCSRINLSRL